MILSETGLHFSGSCASSSDPMSPWRGLGGSVVLRLVTRTGPRPLEAAEQELEELLLRHRGCDQRALAEVAAHGHQRLQLHLALDPLGDRRAAEPMRKIDDGLTDRS